MHHVMQIAAQKREIFGKNTKKLRKEMKLPAVVFGPDMESTAITIDKNEFIKLYRAAGDTSVIDVNVEGDGSFKTLVKDIHYHPVSDEILHVDFYKVNLKEKTTAMIPVEIVGDEEAPIIKSGEGVLLQIINEIEVEALPMDLPSEFTVDVSGFADLDAAITVGDLNYDKSKVEIVDLEDDTLVVKVDAPQSEEPEEEISEEEALAGIEATEELSDEEKASKEAADKSSDSSSDGE